MKYKHGVWMLPNSQNVQIEREPLLTWKQKEKASHPIDYVVPSYGADPDITATQVHEK